ncbi:SNARE associated protein [Haladaptatus sp. W1]|uniref:TVP38/TMEM64 family protein n=1 Tax=Haladaptatus sp. W1 TaxID=1897478 RepID=UPI000849B834|nr:VTT domain-containing protein [Haladaptatus sp. W1]ODR83015.1 SNARE associated protein [Haladaptatus sp. W1]
MEFSGNRRQVAGVGLVALVVVAGVLLSPEVVLQRVRRVTHDPLLAAGLFLGVYLVRPLFAWPTTVVAVAVGYVYGPVVGFPVALGGTVMSAYLPFAAARYFRVDSGVFGRLGDSGERFFDATGDFRGMVASRLVPAPSDAVSAAAGLSNVPDRSFLLGTAIGEVPWMVVAVLAGGSLDTLSVHEIGKNWAVVAVVGIGGLFLLAGPAYRAVTDD